jgi:Tfp pilus assembly protein FimT
MVVLMLIGILTAVILPEMKGSHEDAILRSTARELVDVCSIASSRAISLNELHRLRLDAKSGRYLIERKVGDGERPEDFVRLQDVSGSEGSLHSHITVEIRPAEQQAAANSDSESPAVSQAEPEAKGPDDGIAFYPDGTADPQEIVLRDRAGFSLVLRINPVTSGIRIIRAERDHRHQSS